MLGSIGMPELVVIFVIALIVFGPRRLPDLGRSLGRSITEFRRATHELSSTVEREIEEEARQAEVRSAPDSGRRDEPVPVTPAGRQPVA